MFNPFSHFWKRQLITSRRENYLKIPIICMYFLYIIGHNENYANISETLHKEREQLPVIQFAFIWQCSLIVQVNMYVLVIKLF